MYTYISGINMYDRTIVYVHTIYIYTYYKSISAAHHFSKTNPKIKKSDGCDLCLANIFPNIYIYICIHTYPGLICILRSYDSIRTYYIYIYLL